MGLTFKDITEWTPSTISIVDVPYHPLAYFEVYENDEEFVKKFKEQKKVDPMVNTQKNDENMVQVSESFIDRLLNRAVGKMNQETPSNQNQNPAPQPPADEEVSNAEILEEIQKQNERIEALEQNQNQGQGGDDPTQNTGPEQNEENNTQNNSDANPNQNGADPTPQTVELPLNPDGTLNMDDGVVAKYLPRGTGNSQSLDVDLTRGTPSEKSLNERTGRSENGMNW